MIFSVVGLVLSTILFSIGIAATILPLPLAALVVTGFGAMTLVASCNTILQTILEEDKRGPVMSFFTVAFMGMAPFGSFGAGAMADWIGPRDTLLLGAGCCLAGAALFARYLPKIREAVRPIYVKMGIIREVAKGMESAAEQPPLAEKPEQR